MAPTFTCCTSDCTTYWPDDCLDQDEAYGRRSWFVDLTALNGKSWVIFMAAGPAALAFILAFLDNGITWHIVNHPSNMIQHGDAYNYDTCISAIMVTVNSLLGLPWLVASTVPCIMHISAMADRTKEGVTTNLQESRLTGLFTHCLVLGTCFVLNLIKLVPLPVLYGVFLFMGLVALPAQQFWQRILLFFQQPSIVPKTPYTENLQINRIHLFTGIQLVFFALLYVVKTVKAIAIAFPLFILLCIPVRLFLLPKIFNDDELTLLDGSPEEIGEWINAKQQKKLDDEDDGVIDVIQKGNNAASEVRKLMDVEELMEQEEEEAAATAAMTPATYVTPSIDKPVGEPAALAKRRERQMSVGSTASSAGKNRNRRVRQSSTKSVDSFFGLGRRRREKQVSVDQSIDSYMEQQGLRMPDVPDAIDDPNDGNDNDGHTDANSDISDDK